jgi:1,4-dihydroxy-2-naphthoyl-CoA hydrolase
MEIKMNIWNMELSLELIQASCKGTMVDHIGIEFTEIGPDYLKAKMPVNDWTKQPYGIMHGGASCALAETIASVAGNYCLDQNRFYCVGLEINTSHIKMARSGFVVGNAKPLHLGKSTQVWEIDIHDDKNQLISTTRLRLAVLTR